jgi:hypothetical protein
VEELGDSCCETCTQLATVQIDHDSKLVTIGARAFANTGLTGIHLLVITTIGDHYFADSAMLTIVEINDNASLQTIAYRVCEVTMLTSIRLPSHVQ